MSFFAKRKRKNNEQRPFPAWVIVLVALGVVLIAVIVFRPTPQTDSNIQQVFPTAEGIELTATAIIQQATAAAQGTPQPVSSDLDPFLLTATSIIQQATAQAGTPGS